MGRDSAGPSIENSGVKLRWAHRLESLYSGSIFGTAISQARNDFGDGNLIHCTLSGTISAVYNAEKIAGTRGA
jgi:hypothetical protein